VDLLHSIVWPKRLLIVKRGPGDSKLIYGPKTKFTWHQVSSDKEIRIRLDSIRFVGPGDSKLLCGKEIY